MTSDRASDPTELALRFRAEGEALRKQTAADLEAAPMPLTSCAAIILSTAASASTRRRSKRNLVTRARVANG